MSMKILITGGTGFIGHALTTFLLSNGFSVRITGLQRSPNLEAIGAEWLYMPDLRGDVDWGPALTGIDAVVHLAGLAHRIGINQETEAGDYDRINHLATKSLVDSISLNGSIKRFVFVSSIAVHGKPKKLPIKERDVCVPINAYGQSKLLAECSIREGLNDKLVKWTILRPVLIYGPGNPGNMARLETLLRRSIPVPGNKVNRKSFLYVGNLIAVIDKYLTISDPPSGRTWIVADDEAISTERLIRCMAEAMKLSVTVISFPPWFLTAISGAGDALCSVGLPSPWNSDTHEKLLGDFYVHTESIKQELGLQLPYTIEEGIKHTFR